jgi:outer membrane protein W
MRRLFSSGFFVLLFGLSAAGSASAQQSVNLSIGGFIPRGDQVSAIVTGRDPNDVLTANSDFLDFDFRNFRGVTANGEWLIGFADKFEGSLGIGIYNKTTPAFYDAVVNSDGSDIVQDLNLRVIPFTATVRFLPLGHHDAIVPYVGAGVGVFTWHYSESGQFVDPTDNSIFRDTFTGNGSTVGPVILGGVRIPIGRVEPGFEVRWQSAKGDLPASEGFAGSKIDLGGVNYLFTLNFKF